MAFWILGVYWRFSKLIQKSYSSALPFKIFELLVSYLPQTLLSNSGKLELKTLPVIVSDQCLLGKGVLYVQNSVRRLFLVAGIELRTSRCQVGAVSSPAQAGKYRPGLVSRSARPQYTTFPLPRAIRLHWGPLRTRRGWNGHR